MITTNMREKDNPSSPPLSLVSSIKNETIEKSKATPFNKLMMSKQLDLTKIFDIWMEDKFSRPKHIDIASRNFTSLHLGKNFKPDLSGLEAPPTPQNYQQGSKQRQYLTSNKMAQGVPLICIGVCIERGRPLAFIVELLATNAIVRNILINRIKDNLSINMLSKKHYFIPSFLKMPHHDHDLIKIHRCNMIKNLVPIVLVASLRFVILKRINNNCSNPRPNLPKDRTFPYNMLCSFYMLPTKDTQKIIMDTFFEGYFWQEKCH